MLNFLIAFWVLASFTLAGSLSNRIPYWAALLASLITSPVLALFLFLIRPSRDPSYVEDFLIFLFGEMIFPYFVCLGILLAVASLI